MTPAVYPGFRWEEKIQSGQTLVIKTSPDDISKIQEALGFEIADDLVTVKESDLQKLK